MYSTSRVKFVARVEQQLQGIDMQAIVDTTEVANKGLDFIFGQLARAICVSQKEEGIETAARNLISRSAYHSPNSI